MWLSRQTRHTIETQYECGWIHDVGETKRRLRLADPGAVYHRQLAASTSGKAPLKRRTFVKDGDNAKQQSSQATLLVPCAFDTGSPSHWQAWNLRNSIVHTGPGKRDDPALFHFDIKNEVVSLYAGPI